MKDTQLLERATNYIRNRIAYGVKPVRPEWAEVSEARWEGIVRWVMKRLEEEKK